MKGVLFLCGSGWVGPPLVFVVCSARDPVVQVSCTHTSRALENNSCFDTIWFGTICQTAGQFHCVLADPWSRRAQGDFSAPAEKGASRATTTSCGRRSFSVVYPGEADASPCSLCFWPSSKHICVAQKPNDRWHRNCRQQPHCRVQTLVSFGEKCPAKRHRQR